MLRFDASPEVQRQVRRATAVDPRMVRCGVVRVGGGKGGKLGEGVDVGGGKVGMQGGR